MTKLDDFRIRLAEILGIEPGQLYGQGLLFGDVVALSPKVMNSIDLVEAYATAIAEFGLSDEAEIPTFSFDIPVDSFVASLTHALEGQDAAQAAQGAVTARGRN